MQTDRTLPELSMDLATQVGDLFRNEIRLARAEAGESIRQMGAGIMRAALGIALAGAALTLGLFALAYGLGEMVPMWAGALIAALIGAVIAYVLVRSGLKAASVDHLSLDRTAAQVSADLKTLSRKADRP